MASSIKLKDRKYIVIYYKNHKFSPRNTLFIADEYTDDKIAKQVGYTILAPTKETDIKGFNLLSKISKAATSSNSTPFVNDLKVASSN